MKKSNTLHLLRSRAHVVHTDIGLDFIAGDPGERGEDEVWVNEDDVDKLVGFLREHYPEAFEED